MKFPFTSLDRLSVQLIKLLSVFIFLSSQANAAVTFSGTCTPSSFVTNPSDVISLDVTVNCVGATATLGAVIVNSGTLNINTGGRINYGDTGNPSSSIYVNTNDPTIKINNYGTITNTTPQGGDDYVSSIFVDAVINLLNNAGNITSTDNKAIKNRGTIDIFINSGSISSYWDAFKNNSSGIINTFTNSGSITTTGDGIDLSVNALSAIRNKGGGFIGSLNNSGSITSIDDAIGNSGTITEIINTGTLISTGSGYGINNRHDTSGGITTLINSQGTGNSSNLLTYSGPLPTNYKIIINSSTSFGQLSGSTVTGSTSFGIYSGSVIKSRSYNGVLQGLTNANVSYLTRTGTYDGMTWNLAIASGTTWNLIFSGGPTIASQEAIHKMAPKLRSAFNSSVASSNFANMNTYDCNLFDKNNMCISAGGRYTSIDNPSSNNSAAVVVLGYKVNSNIRVGGFLDQSVNNNTPTGIQVSNKNPMMGAFAVWNKNPDGLGYQVKIANAYQDKDVTTTRDIINTSEAGTGKTNLNTQSYVGELSYAFNYQDSTIVRPYFAVRYTNIKQDAYTEDTSASVTAPLTYAKLGDRSTTALMGVKLNHALTPRTNLTASLGVEQDINHQVDKLTASGVADLASENFNNNIKRTRPVASAGTYYAVAKNQRLSGEVYYQQLPFQSTGSATAYVNYMIGF